MRGCPVMLLLAVGCAQTNPAGSDTRHDLAMSLPDDLGDVDLALDDQGATPIDAGRDLASAYVGDAGLCSPRINEVQTSVSGDARWEFVELFNPCNDFALDGWTLVYRSATNLAPRDGNDSGTLYSFGNVTLPRGGFLVLTGPSTGYTGPSDGALLGLGLADDGAVGLRDPSARLADSVAYGAVSAGHAFIETAAATKPPRVTAPGQSIARHPDGWDTNDNASDFSVSTPTPKGHN